MGVWEWGVCIGVNISKQKSGTERSKKRLLSKQAKHTTFYNCAERISLAEHGKLVAESSEFHLTLSRAHRAHFFKLEIRIKKSGTF